MGAERLIAPVRRTFRVHNERGMHARAATALVQGRLPLFDADVRIEKDGQSARPTSIIELLAALRPARVGAHGGGRGGRRRGAGRGSHRSADRRIALGRRARCPPSDTALRGIAAASPAVGVGRALVIDTGQPPCASSPHRGTPKPPSRSTASRTAIERSRLRAGGHPQAARRRSPGRLPADPRSPPDDAQRRVAHR